MTFVPGTRGVAGPRPNRRLPPWQTAAWLAAAALAGSVLVTFILDNLAGLPTPYPLVLAFLGALSAIGYVCVAAGVREVPETMRRNPVPPSASVEAGDGLRLAVRPWDNRLDYSHDDPRHLTHLVLPGVAEIVDERLRLHHGVIRVADPARAREIIGDDLWRFLAEPSSSRLTPQRIAAIVAKMEEL